MRANSHQLGTLAASEEVIKDLYISLRAAIRYWSQITFQTPQARMGYIGQHLTSVVTGYPGGRSGARGKDLVLPGGKFAEIKTCYRVDQLGKCLDCGAGVASIELTCALCGTQNIKRNDDSKWLIGIRNEEEMHNLFAPEYYYLVLFDFADLRAAIDINARIYEVNPKEKGFCYCMVDYYVNISPNSTAPFNLWPFQLKFDIMKAKLIYHSIIRQDDTIDTRIFPNERGAPQLIVPRLLSDYTRSLNIRASALVAMGERLEILLPQTTNKMRLLAVLQHHREQKDWSDELVADELAEVLYAERIAAHRNWLPSALQ